MSPQTIQRKIIDKVSNKCACGREIGTKTRYFLEGKEVCENCYRLWITRKKAGNKGVD